MNIVQNCDNNYFESILFLKAWKDGNFKGLERWKIVHAGWNVEIQMKRLRRYVVSHAVDKS